ncbi:MAG: hypothetical protein ACRDIE_15675, partial [Chloroflexota bacterium]
LHAGSQAKHRLQRRGDHNPVFDTDGSPPCRSERHPFKDARSGRSVHGTVGFPSEAPRLDQGQAPV